MAGRGEVFVDTAALLALVNRSDALHRVSVERYAELAGTAARFVLSDWVLAEFLGVAARPPLRGAALRMVDRLRSSNRTVIVPASRPGWEETFDFYRTHGDKGWSFVDCTSMLICRDRGIERVLTYDHHFAQFGLDVLLRARRTTKVTPYRIRPLPVRARQTESDEVIHRRALR